MGRLIDADDLSNCKYCRNRSSGKCSLGIMGCDHGEMYSPDVNEIPTAYDVDKVVEQLEEYKSSKEDLYVGKVVGAIIDYAVAVVKEGVGLGESE